MIILKWQVGISINVVIIGFFRLHNSISSSIDSILKTFAVLNQLIVIAFNLYNIMIIKR